MLHDAGDVQASSAQEHLYSSDLDKTQRERSKVVTGDSLSLPYLPQTPPPRPQTAFKRKPVQGTSLMPAPQTAMT